MSKINKENSSKEIKEEDNNTLKKKRKRENIKRNKKKIENKNKEKENLDNIIIGNIHVKEDGLTKRIINSYQKEIKNCEIYINEQKIKFTEFYKFPKAGNYIIKYIFKNLLKEINYMYRDCISLKSLDLSNFNTQNVTNMEYMFYDCYSIKIIRYI